ncbi:hypothetical protein A3A67_00160 [Candidatus Peribacteria bacterium RIFCSPLOWO2_01_FULL_51_18]|nr:MAG: hypothetical protein A3A67_00160 [Candidatus Peribacteria bacterium RIFCSPLOWO2_01_FULL_51_18]
MRLVVQLSAGKTPVQTEAMHDLFFQISGSFDEVSLGVKDERQTIFDLDMRIGALLDCAAQVLFQRIPLHLQFVSARVNGGSNVRA